MQLRLTKRRIVQAALLAAVFSLGVSWALFSDLTTPLFNTLLDYLERANVAAASRPIETGILFVLLPALLGWLVSRAARIYKRNVRQRPPVDLLFEQAERVNVVMYSLKGSSFTRLSDGSPIPIPDNMPVVPVTTAECLLNLSKYASSAMPEKPFRYTFDYDRDIIQTRSFLTLGGPYTNQLVKEVLDRQLIAGFSLDSDGEHPRVMDEDEVFVAQLGEVDGKRSITRDYGFIIVIPNPWNPQKLMCIAFGLWAYGTNCAAKMLFEIGANNAYYRQFRQAMRSGNSFVAVLSCDVSGTLEAPAVIRKFRLLDAPPDGDAD